MKRGEDALALQCKVELAGWHETDEAGCTVTFRLPDAESLDLLKAAFARPANGTDSRYLLHLLKVDGRNSSIDPVRRERLTSALQAQPLSKNALTLSRDPDFWRYLEQIDFTVVNGEIDEAHAKQYIYRICDIKCRRELDEDPEAARHYQTFVIKPFLNWLEV